MLSSSENPTLRGESTLSNDAAIRSTVNVVMESCRPPRRLPERRRDKRVPYPYPLQLTPVSNDGATVIGETIVVIGKHLSERGLDFYYREALPYRQMLVSMACGSSNVNLLLDLRWCRFGQHGWYENGGRFLAVLTPDNPPPSPETHCDVRRADGALCLA